MRRDNFSKWIRSAKASQYSMLFLVFLFPFLFTSADFENQTVQPVFFEVSDDGTLVDNVEYHMIKNNLSCEEETEPELIMEYVEQPVQSVFFEVSDDGTLIGSSNKINFSLPLNGTLADLIKQLTPPAKKEKFKIGSLIKDKSGKTPDADIIFINKENGKISTGNEEIEEGKYEIKIKPKNHPISELTILDADVNKNLSGLVEIDEIPAGY
ncbi:hypothetical protein JXB01_04150, partial [Candidatus Micrarchaeota archaeon]|nr:hypothetical protein [Candidatus Micrarchaeota archaeon]